MTDSLFLSGFVLLILSAAMLLVYLFAEKGSILDPISMVWVGYVFFVPVGMMAVAILTPQDRLGVRNTANALMFLGTICYVIGLYSGRGHMLKKLLPVPAASLGLGQAYFIWIVCTAAFLVCQAAFQAGLPPGLLLPMIGVVSATQGAMVLVSILVLLTIRGRWLSKFFMFASLVGCVILTLSMYWSRRPLVGVFLSVTAFIYRSKLSWRRFGTRALFIVGLGLGGFLLLLYQTGTRAHRFYGERATALSTFSSENWEELLGGITINYNVYEFTVAQFPERHHYLYGEGMINVFVFFVPRFIWESKPNSSAGLITQLWFGRPDPPSNVSPMYFGEMYMNFGFAGALIGLFIAGRVVRGLNTYMRENSGNSVLWLAWLLASPDFASEWRGDLGAMTIQPLMRCIVFLGLAWLSGKLMPRHDDSDQLYLDPFDPSVHYAYPDGNYEAPGQGDWPEGGYRT